MMRYYISLCMLLSIPLCVSAGEAPAISLCPDIIAIIDGLSFGIHGELVGSIYKIARDVQTMHLGKRTPQGRVGVYTFEGAPHTIKSLVDIEKEVNEAIKTCSGKEKSLAEKRQKELKALLKAMKQDFNKAVSPFLAQARGAKEPMFLLISESCTKRNKPKSLLFDWAHSSEDEMVAFDKSITSFVLFDDFCADLVNFLGDLVHSCPKARAQFEKLKEDYLRKKACAA